MALLTREQGKPPPGKCRQALNDRIASTCAQLGVGAVVGLVAGVGDALGDAHPAVGVGVALLVRGQAVHAA